MTFSAPQKNGTDIVLMVSIKPYGDPELPHVYNIGFGPSDQNGNFIDNVNLKHKDNNKVFSTVLLLALTFLKENPKFTIGLDGSNDVRAILYHLMFKFNRTYLNDFFVAIGVDWYVRIFRNYSYEADANGDYIARPRPESFNYQRARHDLYRYYMFHLK